MTTASTAQILRHPLTAHAYALAKHWCTGHTLGDQPALDHALAVAATLVDYQPAAGPEPVAAALVHDAPDFADVEDLDGYLTRALGPAVARLVRELQQLHRDPAQWPVLNEDLAAVAAADKIVSLQVVIARARAADDLAAHWARRRGFLDALPSFTTFHGLAVALVPEPMIGDLADLVAEATGLAGTYTTGT